MTDRSAEHVIREAITTPYRFTVSVQKWPHHDRWDVRITSDEVATTAKYHRSEAEARSHAAQVLAALHQAEMEES